MAKKKAKTTAAPKTVSAMGAAAVAEAIEEGLRLVGHALRADDDVPSVAEAVGHLKKGLTEIAEALNNVATAIREKGQSA
jgi:hypothetical protein